jgi:hypothetical protein
VTPRDRADKAAARIEMLVAERNAAWARKEAIRGREKYLT